MYLSSHANDSKYSKNVLLEFENVEFWLNICHEQPFDQTKDLLFLSL